MNDRIIIRREDPESRAAVGLMRALAREEAARYHDLGADDQNTFNADDARASRGTFLIAWRGDEALACGAFCPMAEDATTAEIRRLYVKPEARRLRIGWGLLAKLESLAVECGYRTVCLETGNRQPEAISLYESAGYVRIPPYGCHLGDPVSVCFSKPLPG